jgi:hypothetical protein
MRSRTGRALLFVGWRHMHREQMVQRIDGGDGASQWHAIFEEIAMTTAQVMVAIMQAQLTVTAVIQGATMYVAYR